MSIWNWIRSREKAVDGGSTARSAYPLLERLEPRLLLSGDHAGTPLIPPPIDHLDDRAVSCEIVCTRTDNFDGSTPATGVEESLSASHPISHQGVSFEVSQGLGSAYDERDQADPVELSTIPTARLLTGCLAEVQISNLPGLQAADTDRGGLQGQLIYLDCDGERAVVYNGPETVGPFDVPAFTLEGAPWAGQEQTVIANVLRELQQRFASSGVIFTAERPQGAQPYSTIYIGGNDSAFAEYGRFLGLAEQVDTGNADRADKGIIFADPIVRASRDVEMCSSAMARVIAHEAGHLLGFSHRGPSTDPEGPLSNVALPVELSLGTPVTDTLEGTGDSDVYSIQMAAGQHLAVQLDGESANDLYDFNELYIRYGALPTATQYDAAGKESYRADQYAEIPNTQEGTYYIMVQCAWDASPLSSYTLQARLPGIDSVGMGRMSDYAAPGIVFDNSYGYGVEIKGAGITEIELTTPWGYYADAQDLLPPDWTIQAPAETQRGSLDFETGVDYHGVPFFLFTWDVTAAQWASLDTGQTAIALAWDGGAWSASLNFDSVPPSVQEPSPTSPLNRSVQPDNVTIQWGPWNSPSPNSYISIEMDNAWGGGYVSEDLPASATSWTPTTPLGIGGFYGCDLDFNTYVEAAVDGVPVTTQSSAGNNLAFVVGIPDTSWQVNPDTGHTYFLTASGSWWQTQTVAAGFGGNLATVNDEAEETWIEQQLPPNEMFWIGFTDSRKEGVWEWVSGEPVTYTDWGPGGEPSGGEAEDAAVIYSYAWHDAPVDWWERGIVELPAGVEARLADDHANTFNEATVVTVPSNLEGELSYIGDIDLFSFDAVAGKTYDIQVDLPETGLEDSMIWLYGTDGQTILAVDDDGGHGFGSRLVWTAPAGGRYHFAVDTDSDELLDFGAYTLQIAERDLVSDTPLAWFDSPALWLELQGNSGVAMSAPYYTGAMSNDEGMLHLLSLDNPTSPIDLGQYLPGDMEAGVILADGARRFYLLDDGPKDSLDHAELVVLDLETSGAPVEINRIPIACNDADSMAIDGDYLYLGTQIEGIEDRAYLEVYDISNPDAPLLAGWLEIAGPPGSTFDPDQLWVAQGRAYVLHQQAGILSILNVQDPATPWFLGQYTLSTDPSVQAEYMAIAGNILWVAVGWELHAIDVSDAANPVERSVLSLDARTHQIAIDEGWAYVATAGLGVKVVDIADPADPVLVDNYMVAGTLGTLAINGGYLYVPTSARRVAIFEIRPAPVSPDLLVTHISVPTAVGSGDVLPVEWIVRNRGMTPAPAATWTDAVFLSADQAASPDELVATLEHSGGLAAGGTYIASLDVDTTGIPEGTYCVIVATDYEHEVAEERESNNTTISRGTLRLGIPKLTLGVPTPGTISQAGELDEWAFSGHAGRSATIVLNPGGGNPPAAQPPYLEYAEVRLLDPAGTVLATAGNSTWGALVSLTEVLLPLDGTYRVQVRASPSYAGNTGNYMLTAWEIVLPRVVASTPFGPVQAPIESIRFTFNHVMDQASFSLAEDVISFTGPNGPTTPTGFTWTDARHLQVRFSPQSSVGHYEMILGPEILNQEGNALDQDQDSSGGEAIDDRYRAAFAIEGPRVVNQWPTETIPGDFRSIRLDFNQPMSQASFSLDDVVSFVGPQGPIGLDGYGWLDSDTLEVQFASQETIGSYRLVVGPDIQNWAGYPMDQDYDFIVGESPADTYEALVVVKISGTIDQDTVLGPESGPIVISDTLYVAEGVTLTLKAGTILKFAGGAGLRIRGSIISLGDLANPVVLTSLRDDRGGDTNGDGTATTPSRGNWTGVALTSAAATGDLRYTEIRYASDAMQLGAAAQVSLHQNVLADNRTAISSWAPYAQLILDDSLVINNDQVLDIGGTTGVTLRNCTIVDNGAVGRIGRPIFDVESCVIAFNAGGFRGWPSPEDLDIHNSLFWQSGTTVIGWLGEDLFTANRNITDDPCFVDRAADNYELAAGSPAIDRANGSLAPAADFLGRPRFDDLGMPNRGTASPSFVDLGAFERQASTTNPDLAVTFVSKPAPEFIGPGEIFTVNWTVTNVGLDDAGGIWQDVIYLSSDPYPSTDDTILGRRTHYGTLTPGASYSQTLDVLAPSTPGIRYVLVRTNADRALPESVESNSVLEAAGVLAVDLPTLAMPTSGAPTSISGVVSNHAWTYVRFDAAAGNTVLLSLDAATGTGATGLYVRYGMPPTLDACDVAAIVPPGPDQEARLLSPVAGTYYIGIYGSYLPGGSSTFTLTAVIPALAIREISPGKVSNGGKATLRIDGDNFDPQAEVRLIAPGGSEIEGDELYQDSATLFATFDLARAQAAPGLYDVLVVNPDQVSVSVADAIEVIAPAAAQFEASITMPATTRPGRVIDVRIDYWNPGTIDVPSPILTLDSGLADTEWQLPGRESWIVGPTFHVMGLSATGPATILCAGEHESIFVRLKVPFRPEPVTVNLSSMGAVPTDGSNAPIDWAGFEADIKPDGIDADTWAAVFANLKTQVGPTWGDYAAALRYDADRWAAAGTRNYCVKDLFGMQLAKAQGLPTGLVTGTLTDLLSGQPVTNATVVLRNGAGDTISSALTESNGTFLMESVSPGTYSLWVDRYLLAENPQIEVTQDLFGLDVRASRAAEIVGTIWGPSGETIARAWITLTSQGIDPLGVSTDADGHFAFTTVPEGDWQLSVQANGYVLPQDIAIQIVGPSTRNLDVVLSTGASISGLITDHAAVPLENATVAALVSGGTFAIANTDASGYYTLHGLSAGDCRVLVLARGYVSSSRDIPNLTLEDTLADVDFSLQPGMVVTGQVTEAGTDNGLAGVALLFFCDGQFVATSIADSEGRFLVDQCYPGEYTVDYSLEGYSPGEQTFTLPSEGLMEPLQLALDRDLPQVAPQGDVSSALQAAGSPSILDEVPVDEQTLSHYEAFLGAIAVSWFLGMPTAAYFLLNFISPIGDNHGQSLLPFISYGPESKVSWHAKRTHCAADFDSSKWRAEMLLRTSLSAKACSGSDIPDHLGPVDATPLNFKGGNFDLYFAFGGMSTGSCEVENLHVIGEDDSTIYVEGTELFTYGDIYDFHVQKGGLLHPNNWALVLEKAGWATPFRTEILISDTFSAAIRKAAKCAPSGPADGQGSGTTVVQTSISPEDKWGPAGYDEPDTPAIGAKHFVTGEEKFTYRIEMWNKPEAPVPTQDATIYDYLDPNLFDLSTFNFTRVGFLKWDQPIAGGQAINTRIDCRPDMNIAVDVTASLNPETGRIDWWFHTVDPLTGDYPEDPNAGFLPPYNPATGFEIGWMEFTVQPRADLPTGTTIANQAFVQFDFLGPWGPAPKEGPWINTIDAGSPTSNVLPLPPTTALPDFVVEWTGQDDTGGSGIASYDVFVSDNGADYILWKDDTTETQAIFSGWPDHTYAFYCRARDNVGHEEDPPPEPDAVTTVAPAAPLVLSSWQLAEDTGSSAGDRLSKDTTPVLTFIFSVPAFGADSDIDVRDPTSDAVLPDSIAGWGTDTLIVTFTTALTEEGGYTVTLKGTATITDEYGNALNGGADEIVTFTLDTTAPVVTVDSRITNDPTPALTGTVDDPDATVQVMVGGNTYVALNAGDGTWILADGLIDPPLTDGTYDVAASATDSAGNVGVDGTADELIVNTLAPIVTVTPLLTNDASPPLTGTVDDASAAVEVTVAGNTYPATNNGDGTWVLPDDTITPALSDGIYDVSVRATDTAGNTGTDTTTDELTIDTIAPVVTVNTLITNDPGPPLTGTVDDLAATVQVVVAGITYTATNNGDGTWALADDTISPPLADGTYGVAVSARDAAGNIGTDSTAGELVVDTVAPTVTVDTLTTVDSTPQLTGTVDDSSAAVQVTVAGETYVAANNGDGTWTLADNTISPALAVGTYDVAVSATDVAGNVGTDATTGELTIEPEQPVPTPVDHLVKVSLRSTHYDRGTGQTRIQIAIKNTSKVTIDSPLWIVIKSISDPSVTLVAADGVTADGYPYIDVTELLGDGRLAPRETITTWLYFNNPLKRKFTLTYSIRGLLSPPVGS